METLLAVLHVVSCLLLALGIALPPLRRPAIAVLLLTGLLGVVLALGGPATRELVTVHTFAGYDPKQPKNPEVFAVDYETGRCTAPGWAWPLPFLGFAVVWTVLLFRLGRREVVRPFRLPLALAWTAVATWLLLQRLAAPAELVQPFGIDRVLFPAGIALALLVARATHSLRQMVLYLCFGIFASRLPAALFSLYASERELGTALDVHGITSIVNPLNQLQFIPPLTPGDARQQFWLIWAEHVLVFPAFYLMSLCGIAIAVHFAAREERRHAAAATSAPAA